MFYSFKLSGNYKVLCNEATSAQGDADDAPITVHTALWRNNHKSEHLDEEGVKQT